MKNDLDLWQFIEKCLTNKQAIMLLVVIESIGSSPGRKGFKMAVDTEGVLCGSIGGGIMEQKLVELAKDRLLKKNFTPFFKKQIHRKDIAENQSGMICSGEQTVLFKPLIFDDLKTVKKVILNLEKSSSAILKLSPTLFYVSKMLLENPIDEILFQENLGFKNQLFIIGGGHCSLALAELMSKMDFHIHLFDNRQGLNTFESNQFVHEKQIVDYDKIADFVPSGENNYVVIMTLGYRSDEQIIRHLIGKNFKYIGLLGSQAKANKLLDNLRIEGFSEKEILKLKMPIGLKIKSQTPMEIAVSIVAEIISIKN